MGFWRGVNNTFNRFRIIFDLNDCPLMSCKSVIWTKHPGMMPNSMCTSVHIQCSTFFRSNGLRSLLSMDSSEYQSSLYNLINRATQCHIVFGKLKFGQNNALLQFVKILNIYINSYYCLKLMLPRDSSNSRNCVIKNEFLSKCDKIYKQRKYGKCLYIKIYKISNNLFAQMYYKWVFQISFSRLVPEEVGL